MNGTALEEVIAPNLEKLSTPSHSSGSHFANSAIHRVLSLGKITSIPSGTSSYSPFQPCVNLDIVILPDTLSAIGAHCFRNDTALRFLVCKATTPPTLGEKPLLATPIASGTGSIYVPDASVEAYKGATNWSDYASRIKGISELPTDNAELYNEIKDYLN